jgi:MFS transporter, ACDE family, multidrug resistance protein
VPFLLGAVVVLGGAALVLTVRHALDAADVDEETPGSSIHHDDEAAVAEIPGLPEEAILAEAALLKDRRS